MANDLEDFLRRAAAKRRANAKAPPRPADPPPQQLTSHPAVIEADVVQKAEPTAYDQVAYDETAFEHSDYQHKTFAREGYDQTPAKGAPVGGRASAAGPSGNSEVTSDELLEMLRRPGGIKQAILLKEILERPDHRW